MPTNSRTATLRGSSSGSSSPARSKEAIELITDDVIRCLNPLKELIAALKKDERYKQYHLDIRRINEIESQVNLYEHHLEQFRAEENLGELSAILTDIFYRFHSSFIQMRKPR